MFLVYDSVTILCGPSYHETINRCSKEDMVDFLPLILLLLLAAFAFILLKPLKQIIRLRHVPTLPIAALPSSGQVEVIGRAGGNAVRSPIADTACVLWHVEVQEYRGSGPTRRWV